MNRYFIIVSLLVAAIFLTSGCKKSTTANSPVALDASVWVNGMDKSNGNLSNPNQADRMRIRAQFSDPQGNHTINSAVATYSHGMGMMDHTVQVTMWDDGTHGDDIPGDGWIHMEDEMVDMMSLMGHGWNQIMGDYRFDIYCFDEEGNESNHISVHMTIQN